MSGMFLVFGTAFAALAAVIHIVFFAMESALWNRPGVWRRFGMKSAEAAATVKLMAYNQGFYNLFLATGAIVGLILIHSGGLQEAGYGISLFALASMALAALVLVTSTARLIGAAMLQGTAPFLAVLFLVLSLY